LDVVGFAYLHQQIKLLGFGTSLNSIVATSAEYFVHLSIFQLSEGAYRLFQIFQLATIRNLLAVAQTSLGFHPTTCSTSSSVPFSIGEYTFGKSSRIWAATPSSGFHMEKKIRSDEIGT